MLKATIEARLNSNSKDAHSTRRVTIKDVALEAGVSIGTVSRAMSGNARVLPDTRARILAAVEHLSYVPDSAAQSLRSNQTKFIGCAVPLASHPAFTALLSSAEQILRQAGYGVVLGNTADRILREKELIDFFRQRNVDGLITTLAREDDPDAIQRLRSLKLPIVLIERYVEEGFDSVLIDQASGAYAATSYLLAQGHRRIALVTSALQNWAGRERKKAFLRAYKDAGVETDHGMIRTMESPADFGLSESLALLSEPRRPTAVIAGVQELIGLLRAVRSRQLNVPNDISLITLGDSDLAELMQPAISAVRWDGLQIGRVAANLLLQRMANPSQPSRKVLLPTEFVIRASCAPPRIA